ncbi:MAG: hypothetical protein E7260_00345 [Lachnospiraceae bacterium]|nr:hypothetical protein [Lachnospiraceae bacterium]
MKEKLQQRYEAIGPYGKKRMDAMVQRTYRNVLVGWILGGVLIAGWNVWLRMPFGLYVIGSMVLMGYVVYEEVAGTQVQNIEERLCKGLIEYLANVKHAYMVDGNVANALAESVEGCGEEIKVHAALFYRILSSCGRKEKVRDYVVVQGYPHFLKLLLVQAYEVSEKGDVVFDNGKSMFAENLEHLRLLIMEELYHRKKKKYEFAGYTFVALIPFFAMPLIRFWGLEFSSDMTQFYNASGKWIEVLTFGVTFIIYHFINHAKDIYFFRERHKREYRRDCLLGKLERYFEERQGAGSQRVRKLLLETGQRESFGEFVVRTLCLGSLASIGSGILFASENIEWFYCLFFSVILGIVIAMYPFLGLLYRNHILRQHAEEEIRQFQSVLLMERRIEDMTIQELLEDMEIFSRIFRPELRKCMNSYSIGPKEALLRLRKEAGDIHYGFRDIADGFLAVDDVGIQNAFAEVENNREMLEKMSQLEAEIQLRNKRDGIDILARIPMCLTLGAYFILPFFGKSLSGVAEVFEILEELSI